MKLHALAATAALCLLVTGAVCAAPVAFFGQDQDPGTSTANSDAAHAQFMSNLASGVGTETFETQAPGTYTSLLLTFPGSTGSITSTVIGSDIEIQSGPNGVGGYPISGTQYLQSFDDFNLAFSAPISAFGFWGTDIGDVQGDLVLTLSGGGSVTVNLPTSGSQDGNQLFWGFYDLTETYTNIAFSNTGGGGDLFGFDDMTIGDLGQVIVNPVPEPGSLAMFGLGLLGLLLVLGRRRYN